MVIKSGFNESALKKKKVKELRVMVREAGMHGVSVAGASKRRLIAALLTGELPPNEDEGFGLEHYDKFAAAFAPVLELIADLVVARLKRDENRPRPSSIYSKR